MKTILNLAVVAVLLVACQPNPKNQMEGLYVNHSEGPYSLADDTLELVQLNGEQYQINRRTGFNLIRDGKIGKRQYETEQWQLSYDPDRSVMIQEAKGKQIDIDLDSQKLRVGKREYSKLKP